MYYTVIRSASAGRSAPGKSNTVSAQRGDIGRGNPRFENRRRQTTREARCSLTPPAPPHRLPPRRHGEGVDCRSSMQYVLLVSTAAIHQRRKSGEETDSVTEAAVGSMCTRSWRISTVVWKSGEVNVRSHERSGRRGGEPPPPGPFRYRALRAWGGAGRGGPESVQVAVQPARLAGLL